MFVVETGAGAADANSYADVSFADEYFTDRGETAWTGTDEAKAACLVRGTAYLGRWSAAWKGWRTTATQALDWPRAGVYLYPRPLPLLPDWALALYGLPGGAEALPDDVIPTPLKQAACEAALRALRGQLDTDLKRGGRIRSRTIGPIQTVYADDAPSETTFPDIEALLVPLLATAAGAGSGTVDLVRS